MVENDKDFYYFNNQPYDRVTRILSVIAKPFLLWWYGSKGTQECKRISKERKAFGTQFHKNVHSILDGKDTYISQNDKEMTETVELFIDWNKKRKIQPKYLELAILNKEYAYAGTADFIGTIDNEFVIADWKTGKNIYPESFLQLSAYVKAFECDHKEKIKSGKVIVFRDGKVKEETVSREELERLFKVFIAAKVIHDWKHGMY